jgi:hypothetical protein
VWAPAHGYEEHCIVSFSAWREEGYNGIIVEGEPTRTQMQCVGCEVQLPTDESGLQLHCPVTAIAKALEDLFEVSKKENRNAGVSGELLL